MGGDYLPSYWDPDDVFYCVARDVGGAFVLGGAGGAAFHFVRGLVCGRRLAAGVHAACANAPRIAGAFGGFGAVFSTLESAAYFARGREYTISGSVAAATATFALQGLRRGGVPAAARWAFLGTTSLLAVYEFGLTMAVWDSEKSIATMVRRNGDQPAPAALLPKADSSLNTSEKDMIADLLYGARSKPSDVARIFKLAAQLPDLFKGSNVHDLKSFKRRMEQIGEYMTRDRSEGEGPRAAVIIPSAPPASIFTAPTTEALSIVEIHDVVGKTSTTTSSFVFIIGGIVVVVAAGGCALWWFRQRHARRR